MYRDNDQRNGQSNYRINLYLNTKKLLKRSIKTKIIDCR
jgi:hypothetical protein